MSDPSIVAREVAQLAPNYIANEVSVCAACGYPTLGSDVCYYCRPLVAASLTPFPRTLAGPTDTAPKASASARTTARQPGDARAVADLSDGAAGTFAAAG